MATYFERLLSYYKIEPDFRGWAHCPCPNCGVPPALNPGDTHFSFSPLGGHCFVCGVTYSLSDMLEITDAENFDSSGKVYKPRKRLGWLDYADNAKKLNNLVDEWNLNGYSLWRLYKNIPDTLFQFYRLGVGRMPKRSSRCNHKRLMVPLFSGTTLFGLRSRRVNCDCPKWLGIGGTKKFLYNGGCLVEDAEKSKERHLGDSVFSVKPHDILYIVENPIDSILLYAKHKLKSVATLGVTIWMDSWTESIVQSGVSKVVVWYDNDAAGCPTKKVFQEEKQRRLEKMGTDVMAAPRGYVLVKLLREAGINAYSYPWKDTDPYHADVGMYL